MNYIVKGNTYRFTVITNSLIRIEESLKGQFEDQPTTAILNRDFASPEPEVLKNHNGHVVEIITPAFHLYYDGGQFSPENLYADIKVAQALHVSRWYFGNKNAEGTNNLKGTARTLDRADGPIDLEDGIMSKDGYSYLDDSNSFIYDEKEDKYIPRSQDQVDGYLFTYGHNYQEELKDFYSLTGKMPLIPRFALGNWWSRYHPYSQEEYMELIKKFETKKIPINVSVIDTDWHREDIPAKYGSPWTGFSWNKDLFPDHVRLLQWLHEHNKHIALNIHPADGIRAFEDQYPLVAKDLDLDTKNEEPAAFDLANAKFRNAYFKDVLHPLEKEGVDFWWIDWQQGFSKSKSSLDQLWLLNHYQYEDIKKEKPYAALILSRYAGVDSHRYPLGFSGDTVISWKSLDFQPYFTITAANIGYTWWSHDIGGHMRGSYDGELSTRWLQFGVFSPINRLHSSNNLFSGKEPWNFRLDYEKSQEKFLRLRAELVPFLDTANYQTAENSVPIVKPLYYEYPEKNEAYQIKNEYIFSSNMLVSPITQPHDSATQLGHSKTWLPEGQWVDYFTHLVYEGNTVLKTYRSINEMPVFVRKGSLIVTNPNYMEDIDHLPETLKVTVFPGQNCDYTLVEHQEGRIAKTKFSWNENQGKLTWKVTGDKEIVPANRKIEIKVVQYKLDDVFVKAHQVLQKAMISFEVKQEIYEKFISEDYNYGDFINYLNNLQDADLRSAMSELAYIREAYHE
ncbi:glycoside hydrolase family 31 protein [Lactobacillus helveticus]|uniref:glycoside hydrolase family 31 protein n=2 Tax=Lactobacillus helveticus TaxID=1587 RepID=UPI0021A43A61|nr:TIM-barrel domain-containing protein [Lactobacillus helveticus]MCT3409033.1 alpha-xylosidase [Lactobacillus helveticus]